MQETKLTFKAYDVNCIYIQQKSKNPWVFIACDALLRFCKDVLSDYKYTMIQGGWVTSLPKKSENMKMIKIVAQSLGCEIKYFPLKEIDTTSHISKFKPYLEDVSKLLNKEV